MAEDNAATGTLTPQQVELKALAMLGAGRQEDAEKLLTNYLDTTGDYRRVLAVIAKRPLEAKQIIAGQSDYFGARQRVIFMRGACIRSRFFVAQAYPVLATVAAIDGATSVGKASAAILELDVPAHRRSGADAVNEVFADFEKLVVDHPDDQMIRWMLAVTLRGGKRNAQGIEHYRKILEKWNPGPGLVSHTYANMLHELGRFDEALPVRRKAVEIDPKDWAYQGLGNTLHSLKQYPEANAAYAKAVDLEPNRWQNWCNWALGLRDEGKLTEAIARCETAFQLAPNSAHPLWLWGTCLEAQGKKAEALEKYREALKMGSTFPDLLRRSSALEQELKGKQ